MASRNSTPNIPVSLGKPSLRLRLEAYYSLIAPDVLSNEPEWRKKYDLIYAKYGGSVKGEDALARKLAKKYGTQVHLQLTTSESSANSRPSSRVAKKGIRQQDEAHYELSPEQQNGGNLSFTSLQFDPQAALSRSTESVWRENRESDLQLYRSAPLLDNLSKFRTLLPLCDPQRLEPTPVKKKVVVLKPAPTKKKLSALDELASQFEHSGPLELLYNAYTNRQRIRVMIRYVDSIRGTLTGQLVAFDKHFNMILRNVDESYTPRITQLRVQQQQQANNSATINPNDSFPDPDFVRNEDPGFRCSEWCEDMTKGRREAIRRTLAAGETYGSVVGGALKQRQLGQILVRGDNVVMVWKAKEEQSAYPHTNRSPPNGSIYYKKTSENSTIEGPRVGTLGSLSLAAQYVKHTKRRGNDQHTNQEPKRHQTIPK
mmetsp:Transcript_7045/g.12641  ORF Transcript_7045/g.12641 Transcript_7045/m.12641 type:complete len:429 (-) Transcript_7045:82-1368(-)